jgi:hypothetical protein
MSVVTPGVGRVTAEGRFARLTDQVRTIRSRTSLIRSDTWMLYVGGVLMPLGVLLIVLGWVGASRTPLVFEQTPYLISGGLLGLGLVIGGGFIYFGYWQSLRIREARQQSRDLAAAVSKLESLLSSNGVAGGTGLSGGVGLAGGLVATPNGSIYHRPDCTVVAGRSDLTRVNAEKTKLEPCRICTPLVTTP